jgi:putative ABC transport system substrate-binding protein
VNRGAFLAAFTPGLVTVPLAAHAQTARKLPRIGFVLNAPPVSDMVGQEPRSLSTKAFLGGLRELGWVEGQNIEIERRSIVGQSDRYPEVMRELVQLKVDVIVLTSDIAALAAKEATSSIPIVMAVSALADKWGLVKSLAKPGGNVTGLSMISDASIYAKRLEYFKEIAPGISRVAVLIERGTPDLRWPQMETAARTRGLVLLPVGVDAPDGLTKAFGEVRASRAQGLFVGDEPLFFRDARLIADFALQHRTTYDVCFPRDY